MYRLDRLGAARLGLARLGKAQSVQQMSRNNWRVSNTSWWRQPVPHPHRPQPARAVPPPGRRGRTAPGGKSKMGPIWPPRHPTPHAWLRSYQTLAYVQGYAHAYNMIGIFIRIHFAMQTTKDFKFKIKIKCSCSVRTSFPSL